MKILVCDDDKTFAEKLSKELTAFIFNMGRKACIKCIYDLNSLSELDFSSFDLAFLDIDLGEVNGISLAYQIHAVRKDTILVFVTNYMEYSLEGYEVQAFRYLLKSELKQKLPLYFAQALNAFDKTRESIRLLCDGEECEILLRRLIYVETYQRHLLLHLQKGVRDKLYTNMTMNRLSELLEGQGFLRVHQSYLVNMSHIERLQSLGVRLHNGLDLPVSARNYRELKRQFLNWKGHA